MIKLINLMKLIKMEKKRQKMTVERKHTFGSKIYPQGPSPHFVSLFGIFFQKNDFFSKIFENKNYCIYY